MAELTLRGPDAPVSPLPIDSAVRKQIPIWEGAMGYFPAAVAEVACTSWKGNRKHNPGEPLNHARGKSADHSDCIGRHLVDYQAMKAHNRRGFGQPVPEETLREELGNLAWRTLAYVQQELEEMGVAPLAPRATVNSCNAQPHNPTETGEPDKSPATDSTPE